MTRNKKSLKLGLAIASPFLYHAKCEVHKGTISPEQLIAGQRTLPLKLWKYCKKLKLNLTNEKVQF